MRQKIVPFSMPCPSRTDRRHRAAPRRPGPRWPVLFAGPLLIAGATALLTAAPAALAQSSLLEQVKRDPGRAQAFCAQLRQYNQQGLSYTSPQVVQRIASQENLSTVDAEVLTTYVVGLHCPDVR